MSVLMTGADSPLGRAVLRDLADEMPFRVLAPSLNSPLPPGVEYVPGDIRDRETVQQALSGVETVLHLACLEPHEHDDITDLDAATRGTYNLVTLANQSGARKFVLGSSLSLFDRLPARWNITEEWRPHPTVAPEALCPWLAELCTREVARVSQMQAICLRFGEIVSDTDMEALPYDSRWLHEIDAVAGVRQALSFAPEDNDDRRWRIFHITAAGDRAKVRLAAAGGKAFGYRPQHDFQEQRQALRNGRDRAAEPSTQSTLSPAGRTRSAARPIRRVVIFGAGGPVAAALAEELRTSYELRLTDVRPVAEIALEPSPQGKGAPLPVALGHPHECRVVDVRDPDQVSAACEGMDAIINCSVVRPDYVEAFRVNTLGAHNVMRAAVEHGIRRVVHTGPQLVELFADSAYNGDYDVPGDAPARPGDTLYGMSKFLGQEIVRVFAEENGLATPVLLFALFVDPETHHRGNLHPFTISWQDSARALRRALEVGSLPSPYEVININADLPHGRFSNARAKLLLDWEPRDSLEHLYSRGDFEGE